jgi:O-antigen ligase
MPLHLRALVVLLAISVLVFAAAQPFAPALGIAKRDFELRRNAWFTTLCLVFLSSDFWLAMLAVFFVTMVFGRKDSNPVAFAILQLFCLPLASEPIPGFGLIGHFIELNHLRVISLALLVPLAFKYWKSSPKVAVKWTDPQVIMCGYYGVIFFLSLPLASLLGVARGAIFYPFIDAIVLFYVARRELQPSVKLRDFMLTFVLGGVLLSSVAIFESLKSWLLYETLSTSLGANTAYGSYVLRGEGALRALGPATHPIPLGYTVMISLLIAFGINNAERSRVLLVAIVILALGLVAPVSRGPWVGFVAGFILFFFVVKEKSKLLGATLAILTIAGGLVMFTDYGSKLYSYLPFVGEIEVETIDYRKSLVEATIQIVQSNPFFGAYDYMLRAEMESLRQGEGIIDLVNTYAGIALSSGLVGLSLFVGVFATTMFSLWKRLSLKPNPVTENQRMAGWILLSVIIAILITIYTVSPIAYIPPIYWLILGASLAYCERKEAQ